MPQKKAKQLEAVRQRLGRVPLIRQYTKVAKVAHKLFGSAMSDLLGGRPHAILPVIETHANPTL